MRSCCFHDLMCNQRHDGVLAPLLAQAVRSPAGLPPGAVLALACHVCMVDAGFLTTAPAQQQSAWTRMLGTIWSSSSSSSPFAPPAHWADENGHEWSFRYHRPGKALPIVLTLSLHAQSGRALVHAVEGSFERPANAVLVGLQLERYLPPDTQQALSSCRSWQGVVHHDQALSALLHEHIIQPILNFAETNVSQAASSCSATGGALQQGPTFLTPGSQVLLLVTAGVCCTALAVVLASRSRGAR